MALNWSGRQQAYIISTFVAVVLMTAVAVGIAIFYETPTCFDGKQNHTETGIDCGGSCTHLCSVDVAKPHVSFVRPLVQVPGRIDVVAYIENRNQHAEAVRAPYTVDVHDAQGRTLGTREGTIDLPARTVVPLFIPGVASAPAANKAFIEFGDVKFRQASGVQAEVMVSGTQIEPGASPRVRATITNTTPEQLYDRPVIATVYGNDGLVIAASRTVVRFIDAFGTAEAIFTWPQPLYDIARVEVRTIPTLP